MTDYRPSTDYKLVFGEVLRKSKETIMFYSNKTDREHWVPCNQICDSDKILVGDDELFITFWFCEMHKLL